MFERFTRQARDVVLLARSEAQALHHSHIGPEHLLLGVLGQPDGPGAATLVRLGLTAEMIRDDVANIVVTSDLTAADADALRMLGIDLEEVRRQVEKTFGPGALDGPGNVRDWRPWRRKQSEPQSGRTPFTPRAKHILEYALRQAIARKDRHIGVEHIVLGLLTLKGTVVAELLHRHDIELAAARQEVLADLDRAA
jgi:ATP-dependent Clp protease ATP-binding subunit ClpA